MREQGPGGYQEEHEMREKVDRELVLAALCGLLERGEAADELVRKYGIDEREQKRAAKTAIQGLMGMIGAPRWGKGEEKRRIDELSQKFRVSKDEMESLAWEVVRGAMDADEGDDSHAATGARVLKNFLRNRIPKGPSFGYTGTFDAFEPKEGGDYPGYKGGVVADLVSGEFGGPKKAFDNLSDELKQLYRDVGADLK